MTKGLHKNSLRKGDNPHQWMIDDARQKVIQQIKAKVERRMREVHETSFNKEMRDLLSFLSTLQEQPVEDKEELSDFESALFSAFSDMWQSYMRGEEVNVAEHVRRVSPELLKVALKQNEQPVCKDLEEAANEFAHHYDNGTCDGIAQDCFKAGAEWRNVKDGELMAIVYGDGIKIGMTKQKEQMMKKALNGEIMTNGFYPYEPRVVAPFPSCPYEFGTEVKVIVVKEDNP